MIHYALAAFGEFRRTFWWADGTPPPVFAAASLGPYAAHLRRSYPAFDWPGPTGGFGRRV